MKQTGMKENYMDHQTTGDDADESIGACPECGAPCEVTWSGLDLVANTGDETLASKHYKFSPPSTQEEPTTHKTLYGIYSGCEFEGGGCSGELYETEAEARVIAIAAVTKKQAEQDEVYKDDPEPVVDKWTEKYPNHWSNRIDCVKVQEFKVKKVISSEPTQEELIKALLKKFAVRWERYDYPSEQEFYKEVADEFEIKRAKN